jgi:hypothetical protein
VIHRLDLQFVDALHLHAGGIDNCSGHPSAAATAAILSRTCLLLFSLAPAISLRHADMELKTALTASRALFERPGTDIDQNQDLRTSSAFALAPHHRRRLVRSFTLDDGMRITTLRGAATVLRERFEGVTSCALLEPMIELLIKAAESGERDVGLLAHARAWILG